MSLKPPIDPTNSFETTADLDSRVDVLEAGGATFLVGAATGVAATDTAAIQAQITAANTAGGGLVLLRVGTYVVNTSLTLYSNVTLRGQGRGATVIQLATTTNLDIIKSYQFDSLVGGGTTGGVRMCGLSDLTLDGNSTNNLTAGRGYSIYGRDFTIERVKVQNTRGLGAYTEWASSATDMEGGCSEVKFVSCIAGGWQFKGPHDMKLRSIKAESCTGTSIEVSGNGFGSHWTDCHAWGVLHTFAFDFQTQAFATMCQAEGVQAGPQVRLLGSKSRWHGRVFGGSVASGNAAQAGVQIGWTSPLTTPGNVIVDVEVDTLSGYSFDFQSDGGGASFKAIGPGGTLGPFNAAQPPASTTHKEFNTGSSSTSYAEFRNVRGAGGTPLLADLGILLTSASGPSIRSGTGIPEGATTAPVGSLKARTDGGYATALGVKASGTGNTGWAFPALRAMQTLATDVSFSLTPDTTPEQTIHTGTLTANRTVTLVTGSAFTGQKFKVTRTGSGAFTLDIGGLKSLSTNQWCEVTYNGSAWVLTAFGSL